MTEGVWLWLAFVLMAMTTIGTRGSFILLGEKGRLPPALQRALRYAPAAALSALVMPDLLIDAAQRELLDLAGRGLRQRAEHDRRAP
jgi:branched-subunit amino acid transport protein